MKIDQSENCEHRFLSIFIDFIGFSSFILMSAKNVMDKRLALFKINGKEFKEDF